MTITVYDSYGKAKEFEAIEGETVFQLFNRNHIELDSPCQGNRSCHKCKVEINGEMKLACTAPVSDGLIVRIWKFQGVRFAD